MRPSEEGEGHNLYNATFKVRGTHAPVTHIASIVLFGSNPASIPVTVQCHAYSFPYNVASPFDTCNQDSGYGSPSKSLPIQLSPGRAGQVVQQELGDYFGIWTRITVCGYMAWVTVLAILLLLGGEKTNGN